MPPDDERTRRRAGDETLGRIADLASGWDADNTAPDTPARPGPPRHRHIGARPPPKPITPRPLVKRRPHPVIAAKAPRGDETNARIAEISTGWSLESSEAPPPPPRKRTKTLPPPPPGSQERKALEAAILDANTGAVPKSEPVKLADKSVPVRAKQPSAPPPLPPQKIGDAKSDQKSGAHARPPSTVKSGPTERDEDVSG